MSIQVTGFLKETPEVPCQGNGHTADKRVLVNEAFKVQEKQQKDKAYGNLFTELTVHTDYKANCRKNITHICKLNTDELRLFWTVLSLLNEAPAPSRPATTHVNIAKTNQFGQFHQGSFFLQIWIFFFFLIKKPWNSSIHIFINNSKIMQSDSSFSVSNRKGSQRWAAPETSCSSGFSFLPKLVN